MAKIDKIKTHLNDIGLGNRSWCEGYISALADEGYITEAEHEELIEWIKQ